MAIIFGGIDFPLLETILIVSVLQFAGLIVLIYVAIRFIRGVNDMKFLINIEREDIQEFEKDLKSLEKFKSNKGNEEDALTKYIKENIGKGYTWEQLKQSLMKQGFEDKKLEELYKEIK